MTHARLLAIAFLALLAVTHPAEAQVGKSLGVVDANTAAEADLATLPGMTPAIAKAVVAARPFDSIVACNTFLLGQKLTQEQANAIYAKAFIHVNLNTATRRGDPARARAPGKRMAREFAEYRPWKSWAQFDKEIGKYVDAKEIARLAQYGFIPVNLNTATDEDDSEHPRGGPRAWCASSRNTAPGRRRRSSRRRSASTWTRRK